MDEGIKEMTHALAQQGSPMRKYRAEHPVWLRPMSSVFSWIVGRKIRKDAQGVITGKGTVKPKVTKALWNLRNKQKKSPWRTHQSVAGEKQGWCCYENCPSIKNSATGRPYKTFMRCEECSAEIGKEIYLCNNTKSGEPVLCHIAHHSRYHNRNYDYNNNAS